VNKTALLGLLVALALPIFGYLIVKNVGADAVVMPRHYIYDSVISKTDKGKLVEDTIWHKIPDFSFTNQLGKQVSLSDLDEKIIVASFFFTHCPTICPRMTTNMKELQNGITNAERVGKRKANFVHFLSFSVDPERDSVTRLKAWADRFQIDPLNWWLLTGDKKQIYDLSIEDMKVLAIDGKGVDTSFIHTDRFVLIDRNRNIRGYYHGLDTSSLQQLSRDIILLHLEKDRKRKPLFNGQMDLILIVSLITLLGIGLLLYLTKRNKKVA
jgi:protein SCO1/2